MRATLLVAAMLLGACAHTRGAAPDVPAELAAPTEHIRPVLEASEPTPLPVAHAKSLKLGPACEREREDAVVGDAVARAAFADCLLGADEAERAYHVLQTLDRPPGALLARAEVLSGRREPSERDLNRLLEAMPNDARIWALLAQTYETQGRDAEALDAYIRAKRLG